MVNKLVLLSIVVFAVVVFALAYWGVGIKAFAEEANVSAQFEQAEKCEETGKYEEAEAIYKAIVQDYPNSDDALTAQEKLVVLYIVSDKEVQAETAYQQLLIDFCERDGIAKAVDDVADAYRESEKYEKALELYKQVINNRPEAEHAIRWQAAIAKLYIKIGDDPNAQAAIDKLIADFSGHKDVADELDSVGDEYREVKKYDKAFQVYNHVVDTWPESEQACGSLASIAKLHIEVGDDANCQAAIDRLIADFSDNNDLVIAVEDIGEEYFDSGKYEKALALYKLAVDSWPEREHTIWAQVGIAKSYIGMADDPNAEAAVDKMIADFSDNNDLAIAVERVGEEYFESGKYEKAKELYKYVVDTWSEAEHTIDSQTSLAKLYIGLGDDPNAEAAIDKLLADFSADSDLPDALDDIEELCEETGRYERAKEICRQIIKIDANSPRGIKAALDISKLDIMSLIEAGDDASAAVGIDKLIVDFDGHPDLPEAVVRAGSGYYRRARLNEKGEEAKKEDYRKAIAVWERVIGELPGNATHTGRAWFAVAVCYSQELREYQKGIEYYEGMVANWPDHDYACYAQYNIGKYYMLLRDAGELTEEQANPKIEAAWQAVIDNYPDCGWRNHTYYVLGGLKYREEKYAEAAECYLNFIDQCKNAERTAGALLRLGQTFEKMGDVDAAVAVYERFLKTVGANHRRIRAVRERIKELKGKDQ